MASRGKFYDSDMERLLAVDLRSLYVLTNDDLTRIHKQLRSQNIISENKFYLLLGLDMNVRKRIYETWDIMAQMEESSVIAFGRILRDVRPDIYERPLSQDRAGHSGIKPSTSDDRQQPIEMPDLSRYEMNKSPHGIAVIFNQEKFDKGLPRKGSSVDAENLKAMFQELNYIVEKHDSLTKAEILKQIEIYSDPTMHCSYDSFICVFLSHGSRHPVRIGGEDDVGNFIEARDYEIHLEMVYDKFNGEKCPSLIGKPKIFIVQACRGENLDRGVKNPNISVSSTEFDLDTPRQSRAGNELMPCHGDFLMAYSTIPRYASLRHMWNGSWFIQELAKEITLNYKRYHLQDMLTNIKERVVQRVLEDQGVQHMQQPLIEDGLNKRVYFT